ncbi:MAG TPA: M13 family metallopeptidase [Terriglobales bacterium]|nr:M13 family metallopeptidase [Terriglobales bacterium]
MKKLLFVVLALSLSLAAQTATPAASAAAPAAAEDKPITTFPYTPSLYTDSMDKSADPCVDFYQYSCGGWMKNNPIPADQARWSVYGKLYQENQRFLWGILDQLAKQKTGRNATQQLIGDHFAACMDEGAVNKLGAKPLQRYLKQIDAVKSVKDLPALLANLHLSLETGGLLFNFGSNQDFENSESVIAFAEAGGLGLPDRDYYLKDDERSKDIRAKYLAHVQRMLELIGDKPDAAKAEAAKIMELETALAKASLTRVERRDPYKLFHKMDFKGLQELTPSFDWAVYTKGVGLAPQNTFNVTQPAFYKEVENQLKTRPLPEIKNYLRWQTARATAPYLSNDFVMENFNFYSKTLRGIPQLRPRWKRCVSLVDGQLGEALGQEFVARAFSPELKQKALTMTRQIEQAMEEDINTLAWMGPETKKKALEKLHSTVNKIGYPDKWRDYSSVKISPTDFLGNVERATQFEAKRQLNKIGKPLDRGEWSMSPPTVNAYYDPQMNDINFPAGVLQPPLYDPKMDDAPNYGDTGGTIGHELTHGFDDQGRQFDAKGNLKDWWTKEDSDEFNKRAQCVADQYAEYVVVDDIKINSKLTLGEDVADLGGLILAWMAWKDQTKNQKLMPIEGLTPEQRFFVGYAQWACENDRPENKRVSAMTDPHSPGKYRVNGLVVNMPEFQSAFGCKAGQPMVKENRCRVW